MNEIADQYLKDRYSWDSPPRTKFDKKASEIFIALLADQDADKARQIAATLKDSEVRRMNVLLQTFLDMGRRLGFFPQDNGGEDAD